MASRLAAPAVLFAAGFSRAEQVLSGEHWSLWRAVYETPTTTGTELLVVGDSMLTAAQLSGSQALGALLREQPLAAIVASTSAPIHTKSDGTDARDRLG